MKIPKTKNDKKKSLIKCAAQSAVIGIIISFAILLLVAALTVNGILPMELSDEYVICAVVIGSAISGIICAKKMESGVITAGLAAAACYLVIILTGTIFTAKPVEEGVLTIKIIIAALVGGCFGGTLRLYRKTKKSRIRK